MTDHDHDTPFRGPRERVHFPRWTTECWRGRPGGCCWLCHARLVWSVIRR